MPQNNSKQKNNYYNPNKLQLGDHLYYNSFTSGNSDKTRAFVNTTKAALEPYFSFLNEAIKAEEKRGQYEVNWKRIQSKFVIRLKPIIQKIKIHKPKAMLRLSLNNTELKEEKNRLIFETQDEMITFGKSDGKVVDNMFIFSPSIFPESEEVLDLNGNPIEYNISNLIIDEKTKVEDENHKKLSIKNIAINDSGWDIELSSDNRCKKIFANGEEVKFTYYQPESFETLYDGDEKLNYNTMGADYNLLKLPKSKILKTENGIEYSWYKVNSAKEEFKIQLIDDDGIDTEKPISEHFFDDEVTAIYQGNNRRDRYDIKKKKSEEKILILKRLSEGEIKPDPNKPIKISVNTTNLKRQKDAIKFLNDSPTGNQEQLIKLFQRKDRNLWEIPRTKSISDWYILTDSSYDGTEAQREFVKKAIATDDFAILEGPPGSGKTTAIIELILQLVREGKKILLSASTHVAIDNVLERIKVNDRDNLVESLRIGDNGRIDEAVAQYQIDDKIKKYKDSGISEELSKQLVIDGANLVCGTTMGIQRHPDIVDRDRNSKLPMAPKYDYMIIDESSKTTFQEFLVPALHAKKWILVGDIKQLSPYIEQSHIIHNFNFLVDEHTKTAIRLVFETLENNRNPYVIEVHSKVINYAKKYLEYWSEQRNNPYKNSLVTYLEKNSTIDQAKLFNLIGSNLILVEDGLWEKYKKYIPKTHIIIRQNQDLQDEFMFKQFYLNKRRKLPKYSKINREYSKTNNPLEMSELFKGMIKEKGWAEEIAWRMIRVYERRMLKNPDSYYEKTFELLKPIDKDNVVDRIYNMTLPSILESIQTGNGEKHRNSTTITEGFDKKDLSLRHQILDYQHRMHPDISKFSREQFYTNGEQVALIDGKYTGREWNYGVYNNRSVWIDIRKKDVSKDDKIHQAEVNRTIDELKKFIIFAKENKHPTEKEWSVAVITFYRPQESCLREALRKYCNQPNKMSRFNKDGVQILNYTVDKFQGMEADIVFLNMVRGKRIGFMDNINRLNVALTRAKFQRVILGDISFFKKQNWSDELKSLANSCEVIH